MTTSLETYPDSAKQKSAHYIDENLRDRLLGLSKDFKTSWLMLGQYLFSIHRDKLYYGWGFEKFEYYVEGELGIKKSLCTKIIKAYEFLENEEPEYFLPRFKEEREPKRVPGYEEVNFLRLAKRNKEIEKEDYQKIKQDIFEKGKDVSVARKDLAAIIKERKFVDPEEEREERNRLAIKKLSNSLESFQKDMDSLKLLPNEVLEAAVNLKEQLEQHL